MLKRIFAFCRMDRNPVGLVSVHGANLHGSSAGQMLGYGGADQPFNNAEEQVPSKPNILLEFFQHTKQVLIKLIKVFVRN